MRGILLVNLGSPKSTAVDDVREYLGEFLMDKRVIDYSKLFRTMLVKGIILKTRPPKSAEAYSSIWWEEGSPLIVLSQRLHQKVKQIVDMPVALGMRYGEPSIEMGLDELASQGVTEVVLMPLYPQYAMSTTETVVVKAQEVIQSKQLQMALKVVPPFYNHPKYIQVLTDIIKEHLPVDYDKLLISYHGVPQRHIMQYDKTNQCNVDDLCCHAADRGQHHFCYRHQCYATTDLVAKALDIPKDKIVHTFQSRLGREPWLEPYTDDTLERLGKEGVANLAVVCPAFVSDCLETLEEIQIEGAEEFKHSGGKRFDYIPCLNDDDRWVSVVKDLCLEAFDIDYEIPQLKR